MINSEKNFNKNILIAVDESENARRAVSYVGQFLAGIKGFKVLVLHVIRQPEEDYFPTSSEKDQWLGQYKLKAIRHTILKATADLSSNIGTCARCFCAPGRMHIGPFGTTPIAPCIPLSGFGSDILLGSVQ